MRRSSWPVCGNGDSRWGGKLFHVGDSREVHACGQEESCANEGIQMVSERGSDRPRKVVCSGRWIGDAGAAAQVGDRSAVAALSSTNNDGFQMERHAARL